MSQKDSVGALSSALGVHLRKVTGPHVFDTFRRALDDLEIVGIDETLSAAGYEENENLCEVDADGQITGLVVDVKSIPARVLATLGRITVLIAGETRIDSNGADAIAGLPCLEHLLIKAESAAADETISSLAKARTLKSLWIDIEDNGQVNLDALSGLPHLRSLLFQNARPGTLQSLLTFPALQNLAYKTSAPSDLDVLGRLRNIERLLIDLSESDDLSFLTNMERLSVLHATGGKVSIEVIQQLTRLRVLTVDYSHDSFAPLRPLTQLETLELTKANIRDFSSLVAFEHLEQLSLERGNTTDLSGFPAHARLEYLNVSMNPISVPPRRLELPRLKHLVWKGHLEQRLTDADFLTDCHSLESLNLSKHGLSSLEFMRSLGNLRSVDLSDNRLTEVGTLADLPSLTRADLSGNRIARVTPLADSAALTSLALQDNPIEDMHSLSTLTRLESLNVNNTGLSDLAFAKRFKQLVRLSAAKNHLRHAESLLELPQIADVDLSNNEIGSLTRDVCEHRSLVSLILEGNPLEGLDPELFSSRDGKATLRSLRDYYRALSRGSAFHDQVKLVLVGNGRVGKTSVMSRLVDGSFDDNQPSTHGIQLRRWELADALQDKLHGAPLKINFWDFGGQDIYHATHRLFMRTRALFLLIWDAQTEEQQFSLDESGERYENFRLPYWIDYIKALSGSPVIVVQNKVDSLRDKRAGYGTELRTAYPPPQGILDYVHVSAKRAQQNGMSALTDAIVLALADLETIGRALPAEWVAVRDRLMSIERRYLEFSEFVELCAELDVAGTQPESIASFLHQAGIVFYQKRDFGDRIILDQKWAIEAVYAVFDRRGSAYSELKLAGRDGLSLDLLKRKVWRHFSEDEHTLLLEFMQSCELCFEVSKGRYYVPQLLPEDKPSRVTLRWKEPTPYCVRITYPFLHRAIIERFLVRAGTLGDDDQPEIWKNGIVLLDDAIRTEAMVEAIPSDGQIRIQARGDAPVELLQMIRGEFDALQRDFPATVTVSADAGGHFVALQTLTQHAETGSRSVPTTNGELIDIAPLEVFLGFAGSRLKKGRSKGPLASLTFNTTPLTPEIFLSYAWGDQRESGESREAIVDRLFDTLMARNYRVVRDKKDNGYGKAISDFMRRLGQGTLIVVVISDKYLRSPYCMFELLEIYEQGGFRDRIFPIVLSDATLYSLPDRLEYVRHWKREKTKIEQLIAELGVDALSSEGTYREYDQYYRRVFNNIDKLISLLSDLNALTPTRLEENNFAVLANEIETRMAGTGGPAVAT